MPDNKSNVFRVEDYRKKSPDKVRVEVNNQEVKIVPIVRLKKIMGDRTINIQDENGEEIEMGPKELHDYLMKITKGGEYTTIIDKHLKEHGVAGDKWEDRKMILNVIINDIKHLNQERDGKSEIAV